MDSYDAIVIGGGPGGYPCAIRLGQLGLQTVCIEADRPGGVCLNWGCIPSKALIHAASEYAALRAGGPVGVSLEPPPIDLDAVQDWKEGIVARLNQGVTGLLAGAGAEYLPGRATLTGRDSVEVALADGGTRALRAEKAIVLATGARTIGLPRFDFDGERVIGAAEAVSLRRLPRRLLVIGGGAIGLELGTVYQKLGSELVVVEALPDLLSGTDPDCVRLVERALRKRGAKIMKKAFAKGYEVTGDGSLAVAVERRGEVAAVEVDTVLVAVGMRPASDGLGLEAAGVKRDARGFIPVDAKGRTHVRGIYAVGDVSGPPLLAHKATKQGEVVAEVIAGHAAAMDWRAMPAVVFTDPQVATVGLSESQAAAEGIEVKVGKFPFAALGKAMASGHTEGFVKVVAGAEDDRVLGVHMVGADVSTLVSEATLAIEMGAVVDDLVLTVHPHPTLGEALMEAAAAAVGRAVHVPNR